MTREQRRKDLHSKYRCAAILTVCVLFGGSLLIAGIFREAEQEEVMIEATEDVIRWRIDAETDIEPPEVIVEPVEKIAVEDIEKKSLGVFKITAYCPCEECSGNWGHQTSTGAYATQGRTVAVDPTVIPYGTVVVINGYKYIAEDCGGAIKGNDIDIFFDSHEEAKEFGVQYAEVFMAVDDD